MTPEQAKALLEPFPEETIGKLPRVTCRACTEANKRSFGSTCDRHSKVNCGICGNWISEKHIHLDYVNGRWSTRRGSQIPEPTRFFAKVEIPVNPLDCWEWTGAKVSKGYGSFRRSATAEHITISAHQWIYEYWFGPVPPGLELDHRCFNRACVNPLHLEAVTHAENVRRGRTNQNDRKTHCVNGHAFDEANTTVLPSGKRQCRSCSRENQRRWRARKSA